MSAFANGMILNGSELFKMLIGDFATARSAAEFAAHTIPARYEPFFKRAHADGVVGRCWFTIGAYFALSSYLNHLRAGEYKGGWLPRVVERRIHEPAHISNLEVGTDLLKRVVSQIDVLYPAECAIGCDLVTELHHWVLDISKHIECSVLVWPCFTVMTASQEWSRPWSVEFINHILEEIEMGLQ